MLKALVSSGCSFAYGFCLEDRTKSYAHLLSNLLDVELIDTSTSGASNENIASATAFGVAEAIRRYRPEEIVVVVGWTEMGRMEFWDRKLARIQSVFPFRRSENSQTYQKDITKFVSEYMWEPCYSYYKLIHAFNYVQSLCKAHGIPIIHLKNIDLYKTSMPSGKILHSTMRTEWYSENILSKQDQLCFDKMFESQSFYSIINERSDYAFIDSKHPTAIAHQFWANQIYQQNTDILLS
jgi:hypothetical protein